jgi:hypothetical protein
LCCRFLFSGTETKRNEGGRVLLSKLRGLTRCSVSFVWVWFNGLLRRLALMCGFCAVKLGFHTSSPFP